VLAAVTLLNIPTGAIRLFVVNELAVRLLIDPVRLAIELVVSELMVANGAVIRIALSVLTLRLLTEPMRVDTLSDTTEEITAELTLPFVKAILAA
jgi:hypothetical protein